MKPLQDLKPDFRTVFVLRDIEELSTEETAETLGISIPAVKSRLAAGALGAAGEADSQVQAERGRRLCSPVSSSCRNSTIIWIRVSIRKPSATWKATSTSAPTAS